jgi:hypothetical protein
MGRICITSVKKLLGTRRNSLCLSPYSIVNNGNRISPS